MTWLRICYRRDWAYPASFSNQLKGDKMKKIIVLMTSLLLLTGCVKVSFTGPKKEEKTSQSSNRKKNPSHLSGPSSIKTRTTKFWKRLRNLSRNIQRLEKLENYLSFFQDIPLEMRKIASPYSLLWIVPPPPSIVMDPLSWIWNMMGSHFSKMLQWTMKWANQGCWNPIRPQPFLSKSPRNKKKKWRAWTILQKQKWALMTLNLRISRWKPVLNAILNYKIQKIDFSKKIRFQSAKILVFVW